MSTWQGFDKPNYKTFEKKWNVDAGRGVAKILQSMNIPVESIQAVILGHNHVDHVGDLRTFPPSVDLVVGPDTVRLDELADAMDVTKETLEERTVRYMSREKDKWQDVGTFKGHNYFGDGSLFILDAPGVSNYLVYSIRCADMPNDYIAYSWAYRHLGTDFKLTTCLSSPCVGCGTSDFSPKIA